MSRFSTSSRLVLAATVLTSVLGTPAMAYPSYELKRGDLVLAAKPPEVPKARVRVAVVDFKTIGAPTAFGEAVAENLRNTLVQLKQYTVVERSQIEKALKEAAFSQSGLVDGSQAVTLGKLLGAKVIVVGSVTKIGSTYTVNARFIDVATGEATQANSLKTDDEDNIARLVDKLAAALSGVAGADIRTASNNDDDNRQPQTVKTGQSKLLASGLSFFFPGVGQFYNGNVGWGLAQAALNVAGLGIALGGKATDNNAMAGGGYLAMMLAGAWSTMDAWFTTQEETTQLR